MLYSEPTEQQYRHTFPVNVTNLCRAKDVHPTPVLAFGIASSTLVAVLGAPPNLVRCTCHYLSLSARIVYRGIQHVHLPRMETKVPPLRELANGEITSQCIASDG